MPLFIPSTTKKTTNEEVSQGLRRTLPLWGGPDPGNDGNNYINGHFKSILMEQVKTKRPATDLEKEVFYFLNDLRESGVTNMYGATQYIQKEFGMKVDEARPFLSLWMKNFNKDGNYDLIAD